MKIKAGSVVYITFLAALAFIALALVASKLPITGAIKVFVVKSGSMQPAIKTGSVVVARPKKEYKIGDVITFKSIENNRVAPVTHRVFDIKISNGNPVYITKGDANNGPDAREIRNYEIIGKVFFHIPYVGFAVDAIKKPIGFTLIIAVPAAVIIYDEIRKLKEEAKKMLKKRQETKEEKPLDIPKPDEQ